MNLKIQISPFHCCEKVIRLYNIHNIFTSVKYIKSYKFEVKHFLAGVICRMLNATTVY